MAYFIATEMILEDFKDIELRQYDCYGDRHRLRFEQDPDGFKNIALNNRLIRTLSKKNKLNV